METIKKIDQLTEALRELGVTDTTLNQEEKNFLDQNGYIVFQGLIESSRLEELRMAFEKMMYKEGFEEGRVVQNDKLNLGDAIAKEFSKDNVLRHGQGERCSYNAVNKDAAMDGVYIHPKAVAAAHDLFGREFKLSSLAAREVVQGEGDGPLQTVEGVKAIWLLDDFHEDIQGTIRIISGSHKKEGEPTDESKAQSIVIAAPAGSVCVLAPGLWFSETVNKSGSNRRVLHCDYIERKQQPKLNQLEYLRRSTYKRISPAAQYILNV